MAFHFPWEKRNRFNWPEFWELIQNVEISDTQKAVSQIRTQLNDLSGQIDRLTESVTEIQQRLGEEAPPPYKSILTHGEEGKRCSSM